MPNERVPKAEGRRVLASPPDALVGRRAELAALLELLRNPAVRLLTLTGPGGVGKTRLALEVAGAAAEAGEETAEEVAFVDLAAITDPDLALPEIARALEIRDDDSLPVGERLAAELSGHPMLLILDNLEQVVTAGPAIAGLAVTCPELTVLVTSRSRLNVRGEHEFPVPPLPVPVHAGQGEPPGPEALAANEAVTLFVRRAQAANPDLVLTEANAPAVAEICRRLDGLPLAIELAAARSRVLSPQAMLARLSGRLNLLSAGPIDLPDRHRTLRDAVAWSHDLLAPADRALFRRLSAFVGAFGADAAEAVSPGDPDDETAVVDGLTRLIEANLIVRTVTSAEEVRFRMLETVRAFARERLVAADESDATRRRHAEWHRDQILLAEQEILGERQGHWFAVFAAAHDDLRAAVDWALASGEGALALRLVAGPVWFFWAMRGWTRRERHRLDRALAAVDLDPEAAPPFLVAKARFDDAVYFLQIGDYPAARERFERLLTLMREMGAPGRNGVAGILGNLAMLDQDQGDYPTARARLEEALVIRRELGDPGAIARTLVNLGGAANLGGDPASAIRLLDDALSLARRAGERRTMAYALTTLGESAAGAGHHARAVAYLDQALGLLRHAGDVNGEGIALVHLAASALHLGDARRASAALAEALQQHRELSTPVVVADALDVTAEVALAAGRPGLAPRFLTAAAAIRETADTVATPLARQRRARATAGARAALDRAALEEAVIAGRALTADAAIDAAVALLDAVVSPVVRPVAVPQPGAARLVPTPTPVSAPPGELAAGTTLSARQREVLRLLVDGLTDPEIAEAIGVGTRTVESHVAAILNKLGLHARTAAVAYAVRHGLA